MLPKQLSKSILLITTLSLILSIMSCQLPKKEQKEPIKKEQPTTIKEKEKIAVGANQTEQYIDLLKDKNVGIVANNTSVIFKNGDAANNYQHLVDSLLSLHINITQIFAPEHGFRGVEDAGAIIIDGRDSETNLPVISLFGKNRKPSASHLENVDIVVFDIQDVGVRFYTYISTLQYMMEACAELDIPVIVLDRPNPNGHYIDGPVVQEACKSFVGMNAIPIIYGMTIGEYAKMVNGEKWMKEGVQCDLTVIPLQNYTHKTTYSLPLRPSPNLPNDKSINLYASVCMFEGTNVSCGRGTEKQFQIFGSPYLSKDIYNFTFIPEPNFGSKTPKYLGQECYGLDLSVTENMESLNFSWLIDAYNATAEKDKFFNKYFYKLAGTHELKSQIEQGLSFEEIKQSWQEDLAAFKETREKYLIYAAE